jgi:multidrug efflux pump subunit AcrA (membrane-fusion protein)
MDEQRALRDALEKAQSRLKAAEASMADLERRRALAEQRAGEFERQVAECRERIALLEAHSKPGDAEAELAAVKARLEALELRLKQVDAITPRLPGSGVCARCGSPHLVGRAEVAAPNGQTHGSVNVAVDADPSALLFKYTSRAPLWASVCSRCGFVELNADGAMDLFSAWSTTRR